MRGRRSESLAGVLQREAQGMLDLPAGNFVVASESRENGQASRVSGSPGVRTLLVVQQIPHCGRSRVPTSVFLRERIVELVEPTVVAIEYQDVAVAISGVRIPLNWRIVRNRHGPGIAFAAISGEVNVHKWRAADDVVRNADGRAIV